MRAVPKVLIVSNDFPPRRGGIQSFVHALASRMPAGSAVVYAPRWEGAAEFDARQPFPVIRHPPSLMLPVPSVARRATRILAEHGCDTVLFGAAAPLGLLAPSLRRAGAGRIVAITHGHEAGWAALPGARSLLRRIGDETDVLTYLGEYFRVRLARALSAQAAARMVRLAPGVDNASFRPAGPAGRGRGFGRVHRPGAAGGPARVLRRGGRVRDAVPDPPRRPGRGGARDRLPGGLGVGAAGRGRRLGRRAGRDPGRRDRLRGARARRGRRRRPDHRAAGRPGGRARHGGEGRGLGRPG